jgi:hypothetical protein
MAKAKTPSVRASSRPFEINSLGPAIILLTSLSSVRTYGILRNSRPCVRMNLEHPEGALVFQHAYSGIGGNCFEGAGIALPL